MISLLFTQAAKGYFTRRLPLAGPVLLSSGCWRPGPEPAVPERSTQVWHGGLAAGVRSLGCRKLRTSNGFREHEQTRSALETSAPGRLPFIGEHTHSWPLFKNMARKQWPFPRRRELSFQENIINATRYCGIENTGFNKLNFVTHARHPGRTYGYSRRDCNIFFPSRTWHSEYSRNMTALSNFKFQFISPWCCVNVMHQKWVSMKPKSLTWPWL